MHYASPHALVGDLSRIFWRLSGRLRGSLEESLRYSRDNMAAIAAVGFFTFPSYYLIWQQLFPQDYENLALRLIGSAVCLPFMFTRYWPEPLRRLMPVLFWVALTYSLPFFFQFMLLKNALYAHAIGETAFVWQMSLVVAFVLLLMLIDDGLLMGLTIVLSTAAAWGLFLATTDRIPFEAIQKNYLAPLPVYLFIIVGGSIYNHHRDAVQQEMLRAVASVGSNIAHELRTPLLGIKSDARALDRYLPQLMDGYEKALDAGLIAEPIRRAHLSGLHRSLERIDSETEYANTIIDMLLINSGGGRLVPSEFRSHSVRDCVLRALDRYPFATPEERARVDFIEGHDFSFYGSDVLLTHVLFNLLKNALYHVAEAGRGDIFIWTEPNAVGENRLYFMDTGTGIHPSVLPRIFDRFYSSMSAGRGSGIGLSFCRMVMDGFGGSIDCESVHGEFTRFILNFPRNLQS
ncbi:MAG: HAMP domain-containing sensor histidine kinase [Pseudomonadales bacterium]|jgi:two-component system CAI-1 autoinducer sensor kinase/phosphatase CqsS|nr:HAMP domain-containing sensor histidine kinase [Pseudomonadales bacterium]